MVSPCRVCAKLCTSPERNSAVQPRDIIVRMLTMKAEAESRARILDAVKLIDSPCTAAVDIWDVRFAKDQSGDDAIYVSVTFADDKIRAIWKFVDDFERAIEDRVESELGGEKRFIYVFVHAHDVALDPDPEATSRWARRNRKSA